MKLELIDLSDANLTDESQWWPDLFLRKGRKLVQVTPEQASKLMEAKRNDVALRTGRGSAAVRDILLHDIDGKQIGRVSFNGRVWLHDIECDVEIPLAGVKTAAQHESEGWKDCR
jgi:hypothetical protein